MKSRIVESNNTPQKKDIWKIIKNEAGYWVGIISGIVTLWCSVKSPLPIWVCILWLVIVLISIIFIAIRTSIYITKSIATNREVTEKCDELYKNCSEDIHKFFHNMRDNLCSQPISGNSNIKSTIKNICCDIEAIYKELWKGQKVSVCIKKIDFDKEMDNNFENWKVKTIARSSSTKQARSKFHKPVSVSENSDFKIILSPKFEDDIFACMDLTNIKEEFLKIYQEPYKNSTSNFLYFYRSTIVVPIRIQSDKINPINRQKLVDESIYHLVGFLCIDTEAVFSDTEQKFDTGIEIAKAIADILYKFFEAHILNDSVTSQSRSL